MKTMYVFHVRNKDNILLGENASTMGTVYFRRKEFSTDPAALSYRHRMHAKRASEIYNLHSATERQHRLID